jgi:hypothetical protein
VSVRLEHEHLLVIRRNLQRTGRGNGECGQVTTTEGTNIVENGRKLPVNVLDGFVELAI